MHLANFWDIHFNDETYSNKRHMDLWLKNLKQFSEAQKNAAIFNPMLRCFVQSGTSTLFRCSSRYPGNGKEQPMLAHNGEQKAVRGAAIRKGVGNKVSGKANKVVQLFWGCFVWLWASNFDQFLFQKLHDLDDPYQFDMLSHQRFHHVHWFCCWFAWMDWIAFKIFMFSCILAWKRYSLPSCTTKDFIIFQINAKGIDP